MNVEFINRNGIMREDEQVVSMAYPLRKCFDTSFISDNVFMRISSI